MIPAEREAEERARVVLEARRWVGTPYHHGAQVLGAGVDCARILDASFVAAGLMAQPEVEPYPRDWHLHRSEERYAETVLRFAGEIPAEPPFAPATVLLFQHGRTFSHGAIVTAWPRIVHAFADSGRVEEIDATHTPLLRLAGRPRPLRAFDFWRRA